MGLLQRACARNTAGVSNAICARAYTHICTWRREPLIFQAFSRARPFSKVSASLTRGHPAWLMPLLILKRESRQQCRDSRLLCVCVCVLRRPACPSQARVRRISRRPPLFFSFLLPSSCILIKLRRRISRIDRVPKPIFPRRWKYIIKIKSPSFANPAGTDLPADRRVAVVGISMTYLRESSRARVETDVEPAYVHPRKFKPKNVPPFN